MPTIHREAGFRFVIFVEDHEPAHVHVIGAGEAKIELGDGPAKIVYSIGVSAGDLRRIERIVARRRAAFQKKWSRIHG